MDNSQFESDGIAEWRGASGTNQGFYTVQTDGVNAQQVNTNSSYTLNFNQGNTNEQKHFTGKNLKDDWGALVNAHPLFFAITLAISIILVVAVIALAKLVFNMASTDYADVKASIDSLTEEMHKSNDAINEEIYNFNGQLSSLTAKVDDIMVLRSNTNPTISVEPSEVYPTGAAYGVPRIEANEIVGIDVNGTEYKPAELVGKTILLAYTEEDYEVFFYGQINESYHWDGYCVTNAYTNEGYLYGICESNFDDGKRLDYISLYREGYSDDFTYANRFLYNGKNEGGNICL